MVYVFHEGFDVGFWNLEVGQFIYEVFMNGSSYTDGDGNERVGFPSFILYDVNEWVTIGVFVVTICKFYELDCVGVGGCYGCMCLVWGS